MEMEPSGGGVERPLRQPVGRRLPAAFARRSSKALQREMLEEEFQQGWGGWPLPTKIRHLLDRVVQMVA